MDTAEKNVETAYDNYLNGQDDLFELCRTCNEAESAWVQAQSESDRLQYRQQEVEWLLAQAQQPETGAVGGKILFADGGIRHTGVALGVGPAGLAGRVDFRAPEDEEGYFGRNAVAQNVSAVTDCWMIRSELFRQAGGFDRGYQDSLFDIDFCLTLREQGLRNLWIPDACLKMGTARELKMEVGAEQSSYAADSILFRQKWQKQLTAGDPFYNPNLSLDHEDWRIAPEK